MLETDAPFMSFRKKHRRCEPKDVVGVAEEIAKIKEVSLARVCQVTTLTARQFFEIDE